MDTDALAARRDQWLRANQASERGTARSVSTGHCDPPGDAASTKSDASMRLEIDFEQFVQRLADEVAARLPTQAQGTSPWMTMEEAIAYSRIPEGTFRKLAARGEIPSHGGRRRLCHRAEIDSTLGYVEPLRSLSC